MSFINSLRYWADKKIFLRTKCLENFVNNVLIYCVILVFVALAKEHYLLTTASYVKFNFLWAFLFLLMLIACKIGNN